MAAVAPGSGGFFGALKRQLSRGMSRDLDSAGSGDLDSAKGAVLDSSVILKHSRQYQGETERTAAVKACGALNTKSESRFDNITSELARIFKTPISLVSLVGQHQCIVKSCHGQFDRSIDRDHMFCDAIMSSDTPEVLVVEDTTMDARFSKLEIVTGKPNIVFYAGAPLVGSDGHRYGTLCVMDTRTRSYAAGFYSVLTNFAELVVRELEMDKVLKPPRPTKLRTPESFTQAVALINAKSEEHLEIVYVNDQWAKAVGAKSAAECVGKQLWEVYTLTNPRHTHYVENALHDYAGVRLAVVKTDPAALRKHGVTQQGRKAVEHTGPVLSMTLHPAGQDSLEPTVNVGIPSYVRTSDTKLQSASKPQAMSKKTASASSLYRTSPNASVSGKRTSGTSCPKIKAAPAGTALKKPSPQGTVLSARSYWFAVLQPHDQLNAVGAVNFAKLQLDAKEKKRKEQVGQEISILPPASLHGMQVGVLVATSSCTRVYRGKWEGKQVAVKILDTINSSADQNKTILQGRLAVNLEHPNIIRTLAMGLEYSETFNAYEREIQKLASDYDGGKEGELSAVWLIQEFCNRGCLYDACERGWLKKDRSPDGAPHMKHILATAYEIASAMEHLHKPSNNIIHGNLAGDNVLLTLSKSDEREFISCVADFGMSSLLQSAGAQRTSSLSAVAHTAPELLLDDQALPSKASDVFSFGVLLWEMVAGTRAWLGRRPSQVVYLLTSGKGELPVPDGCPPVYASLIKKCIATDAATRPNFRQIVSELKDLLRSGKW